jgi:hypothetical protein
MTATLIETQFVPPPIPLNKPNEKDRIVPALELSSKVQDLLAVISPRLLLTSLISELDFSLKIYKQEIKKEIKKCSRIWHNKVDEISKSIAMQEYLHIWLLAEALLKERFEDEEDNKLDNIELRDSVEDLLVTKDVGVKELTEAEVKVLLIYKELKARFPEEEASVQLFTEHLRDANIKYLTPTNMPAYFPSAVFQGIFRSLIDYNHSINETITSHLKICISNDDDLTLLGAWLIEKRPKINYLTVNIMYEKVSEAALLVFQKNFQASNTYKVSLKGLSSELKMYGELVNQTLQLPPDSNGFRKKFDWNSEASQERF